MSRRRAFSIVELTVSLSVLAILLALAIPTLRAARASAMELAELVHQRQSGAVLLDYVNDHAGAFPAFGVPGTDRGAVFHNGEVVIEGYWAQPYWWGAFLETQGYPGRWSMTGPVLGMAKRTHFAGVDWLAESIDVLTHTAFAPPRFWRPEDPQRVEDQQPQRWDVVAHPSQKGLLLRPNWARDLGRDFLTSQVRSPLIWFADGHSDVVPNRSLRPAVKLRRYVTDPIPVLTTALGLRGRDV